jgi:hypothetical protein
MPSYVICIEGRTVRSSLGIPPSKSPLGHSLRSQFRWVLTSSATIGMRPLSRWVS